MSLLSQSVRDFNLLSIGQRGVGKTVFMVGSYAELHSGPTQNLWFDCRDEYSRQNLDNVLDYVRSHGQYPPPTLKVTHFDFSLKRRALWRTETLCHFRWQDLPGEFCDSRNTDFQSMVLTARDEQTVTGPGADFRKLVLGSHGCCVFLDAPALVAGSAPELDDLIELVATIASLAYLSGRQYGFALVLTKGDLLAGGLPDGQPDAATREQLIARLAPLSTRLDAIGATYQVFYSAAPLDKAAGTAVLKTEGCAAPVVWLVGRLWGAGGRLDREGALGSLFREADEATGRRTHRRRYGWAVAAALVCAVGVGGFFYARRSPIAPETAAVAEVELDPAQMRRQVTEAERALAKNPDDVVALGQLVESYQRLEDPERVVPPLKKLVALQPARTELRMQLAQVHLSLGQIAEAEAAYDTVLTQQKNNAEALVAKAVLRHSSGDTRTAKRLFAQAAAAVPPELKTKIDAFATETLRSPSISSSP